MTQDNLYVVPVSGGKDSQLVMGEAVDAFGRENVIGVHHYTGIDHPLTYEHMDYMRERYGVPIENTVNPNYADIWEVIDKRNAIPGRLARFCTDELKIKSFRYWLDKRTDLERLVVLMGMRAAESQQRMGNYGALSPTDEFSLRDMNPKKILKKFECVRVRLPIVDLSTPAVFERLRARGDKINPLYARGHKRVGCYPCILAGPTDYGLAARDPVGRETIIKLRDFKALLVASFEGKYAPSVVIEHDLDAILDNPDLDPFGFYDEADDTAGGCQWCSI